MTHHRRGGWHPGRARRPVLSPVPGPAGSDTFEVPLPGGLSNAGHVVRRGDTVRRPMRPTSLATHALLRHLEEVGFEGATRFLGVDANGREVDSYIPGDAAIAPLPAWALTDEAMVSVAGLLRAYHDAQATFDPSPYRWPLGAPKRFGHTLISHNDPCPDNVVFRDGRAVALIDFDLASPGSRLWDVACAARLWSPLIDPADVPDPRHGRALQRMRLFLDAYGLPARERADFAEVVLTAYQWCYDVVARQAAEGHASFVPYWFGGGAARANRGMSWLDARRGEIDAAVLSGE